MLIPRGQVKLWKTICKGKHVLWAVSSTKRCLETRWPGGVGGGGRSLASKVTLGASWPFPLVGPRFTCTSSLVISLHPRSYCDCISVAESTQALLAAQCRQGARRFFGVWLRSRRFLGLEKQNKKIPAMLGTRETQPRGPIRTLQSTAVRDWVCVVLRH